MKLGALTLCQPKWRLLVTIANSLDPVITQQKQLDPRGIHPRISKETYKQLVIFHVPLWIPHEIKFPDQSDQFLCLLSFLSILAIQFANSIYRDSLYSLESWVKSVTNRTQQQKSSLVFSCIGSFHAVLSIFSIGPNKESFLA